MKCMIDAMVDTDCAPQEKSNGFPLKIMIFPLKNHDFRTQMQVRRSRHVAGAPQLMERCDFLLKIMDFALKMMYFCTKDDGLWKQPTYRNQDYSDVSASTIPCGFSIQNEELCT